jgi:hypothetical protein
LKTAVSAELDNGFLLGLDRSNRGEIIPAHRPPRRGRGPLRTVFECTI